MTPRPVLAESQRTPISAEKIARFHAEVVHKVEATVASDAVVVVGMAQNPFVKRVRAALDQAGIPFTYLEFGSYLGQWKQRLAIKMWSGWPTFPQVFVRGALIGGHHETTVALADGSLQARLAETNQ